MPHVLVICTANICRSPVVEAILRARLWDAGYGDWQVSSAGTLALPGYPAATESVAVAAARGLDISRHESRRVEEHHLEACTLALCMELGHREALHVEYPAHRHKVRLLTEMVGGYEEVEDPIGGPPEEYERMAREVTDLVDRGLPQIVELALANARRQGVGA